MSSLEEVKVRIREEELIGKILEELECTFISKRGNRYEAGLPPRYKSNNRRAVQVYDNEYLSIKIRNKGISGDIYSLVGYILYDIETFEELMAYLHQVKAWIYNLFDWEEDYQEGDDFSEIIPKVDRLKFLRGIKSKRKERNRTRTISERVENEVLDKESIFSKYWKYPHVNFLEDGVSLRTQNEYGVMFDSNTNRVVFPIYNEEGELVSVKGRYVGEEERILKEIKYLYLYRFDKGAELFNLHKAKEHIKRLGYVIIFESEKSCMKAWQYGIKNTVAISGFEITPIQVMKIKKLGVDLVFAYDKDMTYEENFKSHIKGLARTRLVYYLEDKENLLGEKDSPIDKGLEVFKKLYETKVQV